MQQQPPAAKPPNNSAFIDGQNLYRGMQHLGWPLDYGRFRIYLTEKYHVATAYLFIGEREDNRPLYLSLQKHGYVVVLKQTVRLPGDRTKGNVDAELVFQAMLDYHHDRYDQAVIVTSDGDFSVLVHFLRQEGKLAAVISPERRHCSRLLRQAARQQVQFLDRLRHRLEYKKQQAP